MKQIEISFQVIEYASIDEMPVQDRELLLKAKEVTQYAYAPYSSFQVGAAARLQNGELITGTNQENASYPAGICAERVLMSAASSLFPGVGIKAIAIAYNNLNGKSDRPASPCGICRQSFAEFQQRTKVPFKVILGGMEGPVQIIDDALHLLPLVFDSGNLK